MFRKAVSSFVLVAFISMLFYSCTGDNTVNPGQGSGGTGTDLEEALNADADVTELIDIQLQLVGRALYGEVSSSQMRYALENDDPEYTAALFGYSASELENLEGRILQLCEAISERYPRIREQAEESSAAGCRPCDIETFLRDWDTVLERYSSDVSRSSCFDPARCQVIPLVTGLIMCAYTLGWTVIGYLACSYVVACSFCEGGWADVIC